MPTATTRPDYYNSTATSAVATYQFEEVCYIEYRNDEDEFERLLNDDMAADAAALAEAEQLMPSEQALRDLANRFPAPQEWWDED